MHICIYMLFCDVFLCFVVVLSFDYPSTILRLSCTCLITPKYMISLLYIYVIFWLNDEYVVLKKVY